MTTRIPRGPDWSRLRTAMRQKPDCDICDRADNDIAVSWIRAYGKGRIFCTRIGHLPALFATPSMARFFLAGVQFALGELGCRYHPEWRAELT
jgi:type 1 glutamine amidotransferase